ncbi:ATP-binding cassette subfamily C protein CydC [Kribbella sp. VKM Ac-2569]|uniref:ATP-binding cassette domain-containing protein n=1 Tax=Kribbella sp. VKM Ac-2569 TaxID=2512220 RepID=UPI00102B61AB|nr:ATP-binding cassette domain-containing protein [Kribbella sp. VKM Ac-2569]RZT07553.1 ATP-binding cassette subfamily C protein CydC [Kribbella sp. VKM Ac-2569]
MKAKSLAATGFLLAVLAEACSVGILGLSGWFVAASAVAGASAYSAFSYLAPSGGVRAFALGRISAGYANRVVLHAAALRRISATRLAVYDHAAGSEDTSWSGQSLDRVMADADTTGLALIQATTPVVVAAVMTAGGCVAIVLAGYPIVALTLAVAVVACAMLAAAAARRMDDTSRTRGLLRTELVTAIEAWPEMASLGAVDQLARRTLGRLTAFESGRNRHAATTARAVGGARGVTATALLLAVVLTARDGATIATLVFVALLTAGVLANAERLVSAAGAWVQARQADAHLRSAGENESRRPEIASTFRATYDGDRLAVAGYQLPETPTREAREIAFTVAAGNALTVTGVSGSGKTTLLTAITTVIRQQTGSAVITAVLADDYLFTGTVADNIRLANPAATEADITDLLAAMALEHIDPQTPVGVGGRGLSGGEQRRLHLARALASQPDVLLIDEPTAGLDTSTAADVLAAVRRRLPRAVLVLAIHETPADPNLHFGVGARLAANRHWLALDR